MHEKDRPLILAIQNYFGGIGYISKSNKVKVAGGRQQIVQLIFKISQHQRDKILLDLIAKYLKSCGVVPFILTVRMLLY